jgi:hypothetical protein
MTGLSFTPFFSSTLPSFRQDLFSAVIRCIATYALFVAKSLPSRYLLVTRDLHNRSQ